MAKTPAVLEVFVASPSDVIEERKILEEVINEFNITWGDTHAVRLELIKWETHTRPGLGDDPQDVVNKQIDDKYDVFLGIMWGRFGSPTHRAGSGTEEEFNRACSRLRKSPETVQILFYFKDAPIRPSELDVEQIAKVKEFQKKIADEHGGLYHEFETTEDFRTKTRMHLSTVVQDWQKATPATGTVPATTTAPAPASSDTVDPLANLRALTDEDDDEGLFELVECANDAMAIVVDVVENMSAATNHLGEKFEERTKEATKLTAGGTTPEMKAVKRVSNSSSNDLEVYTKRLAVEIPEFHKHHSLAMETFGKIAMVSGTELGDDPDDIATAHARIQEYRHAISTSSNTLKGFQATITGLPRMTTAFNRARKRAAAVLEDLLVQLRSAMNQSGDVEQLLERLM